MTTFADLGLSDSVLAAVEALGYTEPTPVQAQSIPLALEGRDMIAAAKTGTGKTAAFSLPSLDRLERSDRKKAPTMLVITPTRELAMQIQEVCSTIAKARGLRVANVVGGVKIEPQINRLARGVDVLIATPGRLIDLMNQKAVDLSQVQILVLDEADRMLDMGFLPSVRRIVEATPSSRQTLLFSATIDKGVLSQVDAMLNDPAIVQIAAKGETADTVEQYIARVPHTLKPDLLAALLQERGAERVIVFARTRHRADAACRKLKRAGYRAEAIHSDRSQNQRKRALDNFASGATDILVATDVLARGIDVDEVAYVVNYDVPVQAEDYVHRIGRTGRAGAEGFAVTFVAPENKPELAAIEKLIKRPIPEIEVPGFNLEEAAEAAAARATRANAKHDPELAAAAREQAKKDKRKARARARAEEEAAIAAEEAPRSRRDR
ncbi:DEAD/DEAH box helicase, partial [uncultured Adlercreutzia sp.]|uniref:DEAD/DEAH box helicase n=1 Tax=uncultured Adlercreutzia sp. TaxID=875803 RepID=UPI0025A5D25E